MKNLTLNKLVKRKMFLDNNMKRLLLLLLACWVVIVFFLFPGFDALFPSSPVAKSYSEEIFTSAVQLQFFGYSVSALFCLLLIGGMVDFYRKKLGGKIDGQIGGLKTALRDHLQKRNSSS